MTALSALRVCLYPGFVDLKEADCILERLCQDVPWKQRMGIKEGKQASGHSCCCTVPVQMFCSSPHRLNIAGLKQDKSQDSLRDRQELVCRAEAMPSRDPEVRESGQERGMSSESQESLASWPVADMPSLSL